jgi:hypothetical protein
LSFFSNDSLLEDGGVAGSREWAEYFVGLYMLFCLYQMTNDLGSLILPSFFRLSQPIYLFQLRFREWEVSILARLWELWEPFKLVDPNGLGYALSRIARRSLLVTCSLLMWCLLQCNLVCLGG